MKLLNKALKMSFIFNPWWLFLSKEWIFHSSSSK